MRLAKNSLPCLSTDAGYVLTSLSKLSTIDEYGWTGVAGDVSLGQSVWWTVNVPEHERQAAHLQVRRVVERAIATHSVV